jgi:hypothetical protein
MRRVAMCVSLAFLAACSGGGGNSTPASSPNQASGLPAAQGQTQVRLLFTIPGGNATSSTARAPQFVSKNIQSAVASALQNSGSGYQAVNSVVLDLSPTSPNCTSNPNGSRSCSVFFPAPNGTDEFELDTYDVAPADLPTAASVARRAQDCNVQLGNARRTQQFCGPVDELSSAISAPVVVTPGSAISVSLALQGIVAGFSDPGTNLTGYPALSGARSPQAMRQLLYANCSAFLNLNCLPQYAQSVVGGVSAPGVVLQTINFPGLNPPNISALDGSGVPITGATPGCPAQDQFANSPIPLSVSEPNGGGGSTQFQIAPCAGVYSALETSGAISWPLDLVKVTYNGGGSAGTPNNGTYFAAVTAQPPVYPLGGGGAILTGIITTPGQLTYIIAPLFAYLVDADTTVRTSAGGTQVVAHLAGPGTSAQLYALQYIGPNVGFNSYSATPSAGCSNAGQNVVSIVQGLAESDGNGVNFSQQWTLNAGNLASGNPSSCTITISDGVSGVPVTILNSVAGGNGATITIGPSPTPSPTPTGCPVSSARKPQGSRRSAAGC